MAGCASGTRIDRSVRRWPGCWAALLGFSAFRFLGDTHRNPFDLPAAPPCGGAGP